MCYSCLSNYSHKQCQFALTNVRMSFFFVNTGTNTLSQNVTDGLVPGWFSYRSNDVYMCSLTENSSNTDDSPHCRLLWQVCKPDNFPQEVDMIQLIPGQTR